MKIFQMTSPETPTHSKSIWFETIPPPPRIALPQVSETEGHHDHKAVSEGHYSHMALSAVDPGCKAVSVAECQQASWREHGHTSLHQPGEIVCDGKRSLHQDSAGHVAADLNLFQDSVELDGSSQDICHDSSWIETS